MEEHVVLYRQFRPLAFDDVVGQKASVGALRQSVISGKIAHAYLFCGQHGTGKTTIAKIFSRAVNCEHPVNGNPCNECPTCKGILDGSILDVVEMDAASNNGVDDIRPILQEVNFAPSRTKYKVYIIDEVHMLSKGAFNALLKTIEEPPKHVIFLFATTEVDKIPSTIISRCQRYEFRRIPISSITSRMRDVSDKVGIKIDDDALKLIASRSDGALRDALSLLDQISSMNPDKSKEITSKDVEQMTGTVDSSFMFKMANCLIDGRFDELIDLCAVLRDSGKNLTVFTLDLAAYFRDLLIIRVKADPMIYLPYPSETVRDMYQTASKVNADTLVGFISFLSKEYAELRHSPDIPTSFEIMLMRLCGRKSKLPVTPIAPATSAAAVPEAEAKETRKTSGFKSPFATPSSASSTSSAFKSSKISSDDTAKSKSDDSASSAASAADSASKDGDKDKKKDSIFASNSVFVPLASSDTRKDDKDEENDPFASIFAKAAAITKEIEAEEKKAEAASDKKEESSPSLFTFASSSGSSAEDSKKDSDSETDKEDKAKSESSEESKDSASSLFTFANLSSSGKSSDKADKSDKSGNSDDDDEEEPAPTSLFEASIRESAGSNPNEYSKSSWDSAEKLGSFGEPDDREEETLSSSSDGFFFGASPSESSSDSASEPMFDKLPEKEDNSLMAFLQNKDDRKPAPSAEAASKPNEERKPAEPTPADYGLFAPPKKGNGIFAPLADDSDSSNSGNGVFAGLSESFLDDIENSAKEAEAQKKTGHSRDSFDGEPSIFTFQEDSLSGETKSKAPKRKPSTHRTQVAEQLEQSGLIVDGHPKESVRTPSLTPDEADLTMKWNNIVSALSQDNDKIASILSKTSLKRVTDSVYIVFSNADTRLMSNLKGSASFRTVSSNIKEEFGAAHLYLCTQAQYANVEKASEEKIIGEKLDRFKDLAESKGISTDIHFGDE